MRAAERSVQVTGRSSAHGFTLIEVLVAMTIVAFAFVGLLGLHNRNLVQVSRDQDLATATLLARKTLAAWEMEGFPEIGVETGQFESAPGFVWEREVTEIPDHPDLRRMRLRVIWDERIPDACEIVYYVRDTRDPQR